MWGIMLSLIIITLFLIDNVFFVFPKLPRPLTNINKKRGKKYFKTMFNPRGLITQLSSYICFINNKLNQIPIKKDHRTPLFHYNI